MKIGIICFWDRLATPYLQKYESILDKQHVDYDCILWNRTGDIPHFDPEGRQQHEKVINVKEYKKLTGKIYSFLLWRIQIARLLKKEKYSYLIVLTTHPAILLYPIIARKYKNKFIFDIRDYTQEKYWLYRKLVMRIISLSALTTISSKGFMKWLDPNDKIIPNHNITNQDIVRNKKFDFNNRPLQFNFVGNVRLDKQTESLLKSLANTTNFYLRFYGRILPSCSIETIIKEHKIENVSLEGSFQVDEKPEIYSKTDLINAVYANSATNLSFGDSTPIPNRLYDAIVFKCPLVASKGTYLAELIEKYQIGVVINGFDSDVEQQLLQYLEEFNAEKFINGCEELIREVMFEERQFIEIITSLLFSWKDTNVSKF